MNLSNLQTTSLTLVPKTRDEVLAGIDELPADVRCLISDQWLAQLECSGAVDPWIHGFKLLARENGVEVGQCGFKGHPTGDGVVEIAYQVDARYQGRGYATEAAAALVEYAFGSPQVNIVRAHTLPGPNASTRVLTKCGFGFCGEVTDPEDGLVWRWELRPLPG